MSLQVEREKKGRVLVVRLIGELDHHTSEQVRKQVELGLDDKDVVHLVLNLDSLEFMDSSGLGVILGRYKRVAQAGGRTAVCALKPAMRTLFEMSGLLKIMTVYPDESEALEDLKEASV
ncbi:MAG: anti-sigma factor antagonist [Bacilli bacterium]|nr:anti-sigma factor antagonist [Bacilli bacterium]